MSVEHKLVRTKVFIEGVNVNDKIASVNGLDYRLNDSTTCSLSLECDDFDFIVTEEDLQKIDKARKTESLPVARDPDLGIFNNKIKSALLTPLILLKSDMREDNPYVYEFGLYDHIIPINANVRVFVYVDGKWYFKFTGAVISRSLGVSEMGNYNVTYNCRDPLYFLEQASISTSAGIWEPSQRFFDEVTSKLKQKESDEVTPTEISPSTFLIPNIKMDFQKFGLTERKFLDSLAFAVYGDIPADLTSYGTEDNIFNLVVTHPRGKGDKKNQGSSWTVPRNIEAAGLFGKRAIRVGVWGRDSRDFLSDIRKEYPSWDILGYENLNDWDTEVDNEVRFGDLISLSVIEEDPGFPWKTTEDIVDIIGEGTKIRGIYSATGGSLKILLPGSLTDSVYQQLKVQISLESPDLAFLQYSSRLQMFSWVLTNRTNFMFYTSPKGNIIVEFPLYDIDVFGTDDWRVFNRTNWTGSFGDTEDFTNLYTLHRVVPQAGAVGLEFNNQNSLVGLEYLTEGAINQTLLEKIGVRVLDQNVITGFVAMNSDEAKAMAQAGLAVANRKSYGGSISLKFEPRLMLNRQAKFEDVGRSGLVMGQSTNLPIGEALNTQVTLGFMRKRGADGKYNIAFNSKIEDISIDYGKFFGNAGQ